MDNKRTEQNLVEQAQRGILSYIAGSHNTALPKEQELSERLGVSRVVVREALSRLRAVGIIETRRKMGSKVVVPEVFGVLKSIIKTGLLDKDTLRDLYQLRLMIEIGIADFVYMYKTDEQMSALDAIVAKEVTLNKEMATAKTNEEKYAIASRLTEVDIEFHSKLFEMTGNKSLMDFQYILRHLFSLYYPKIKTDWHNLTLVSHVSLFNILRTGTPDAFRMGMRLHLQTQFDNMEAILDKAGQRKDTAK